MNCTKEQQEEMKEKIRIFGAPEMLKEVLSKSFKKKWGIEFNKDSLGGFLEGVESAIAFIKDLKASELFAGLVVAEEYFNTKYKKLN